MIWLFKVNEVFWNEIPIVNKYYTFDTNDIEFDITQYDISLYFGTADYYLINESNSDEIFKLFYNGTNINPTRMLLSKDNVVYSIIQNFYIEQTKMDFSLFFENNSFVKKGNYYKHEDLINLTIADTTVLNQIQFTIGFQDNGGSFFGISKNIRTVKELQELLFVLCGFDC